MGALAEHAAQALPDQTVPRRVALVRAILDDLDDEDRALLDGWLRTDVPEAGQHSGPDRMGNQTIVDALQAIGYSISSGTIKAYRRWLAAQDG